MYNYNNCSNRDILFIDLKSFFASVSCIEKGLDPLTTKLAVVADTKRQGSVVLAATPPLKKLGIKTGSRLYEIPQRNDIYIINPSMRRYINLSVKINKIFLDFVAPMDLHTYSVDESAIDVTESLHLFADTPYEIAQIIQKRIYDETQIFSTIGIGPNILIAKLTMDLEAKKTKEGIAQWRYEDIPAKLWHIEPLTKMWGINKRTEIKLHNKGIYRIGDLANYPVKHLKKDFGVVGVDLHLHANGIDESMIRYPHKTTHKSLGKSQILMRDYEKDELKTILIEQVEDVYYRVRNQQLYPTRISINVGYSNDGGVRKQFTNKHGYQNTYAIINELWRYLSERLEKNALYRTIAVSFGNFIPNKIKQLSLFEDPIQVKTEVIEHELDAIRFKYGKNIVMKGSSLTKSGTLKQRSKLIAGHKA